MRFRRLFVNVFILFFMAMLLLPLVFVDLSVDRKSEQENRMLADRPALRELKTSPETFIREFDVWFRDSTGFREPVLALYNKINAAEWNERYTDGTYVYLIGRQGHRYFADVEGRLIPKFQGKPLFSDEQLRDFAEKLDEVEEYLDAKGIPFVVMFCTDKESIYPEYYPETIKRGPEPIPLDVVTTYLQDHTNVDVFNIRQALLAEKEKYPLYPKASGDLTHYNEIGAFFAYQELVRHIQVYFPDFASYGADDVAISYDDDGVAAVSLKQAVSYRQLDPDFFNDVPISRLSTWENVAFKNSNADLPTILILRDSYAGEGFFTKYIAQQFGETIAIHYDALEHLEEYVTRYDPDIIVFESAERALEAFASYVTGIKL